MKGLFGWFILSYFLGCGTSGESYYEETAMEEAAMQEMIEEFEALEALDEIQVASLRCDDLGFDEMDVPHNNVILEHGDKDDTVGQCLTCQPIASADFESMDIPSTALSACGGWFAGGGDYFYCILNGDQIEVYAGWQDEGQIEEDDFGYHWKKTHSFDL